MRDSAEYPKASSGPIKINGWMLALDRGPQFLSILILFLLPFITQDQGADPLLIKQTLAQMLIPFMLVFWLMKTGTDGKLILLSAPAHLPGLLLLAWILLTIPFSPHSIASLRGLADWLWVPLWYFLLTQTSIEIWRAENQLLTFMAAGLGTSLWGIAQAFNIAPGVWQKIVDEQFAGRVIAGFGNPEFLAGFLLLVWPLALGLLLKAKSKFSKSYWAITLFASLLCLVLTQSKAGWLAAFVQVIVFSILMFQYRGEYKRLGPILLSLVLALLLAFFVGPLSKRTKDAFDPRNESIQFRMDVWKGAVEMIKQRPALGTGFGTFSTAYPPYRPIPLVMRQTQRSYEVDHAHNFLLEWIAEMGWVGTLLMLLFWLAVLWPWWKLFRAHAIPPSFGAGALTAFAGVAVDNLFNMDHSLATTIAPLLFLASMSGPLSQRFFNLPGYPIRKWEYNLGTNRWVIAVLALGSIFWAFSNTQSLMGRQLCDSRLGMATEYSRQGQWDKAIPVYEKCLKSDPQNLEARYFLASALYDRGLKEDMPRSLELFDSVSKVSPDYVMVHYKKYLVMERLGLKEKAMDEKAVAIRLDPMLIFEDPEFLAVRKMVSKGGLRPALEGYRSLLGRYPANPPLWLDLGNTLALMGRRDEAIKAYKSCIDLYPEYVDALLNMGYVAFSAGQKEQASRALNTLKKILPQDPRVLELDKSLGGSVSNPSKGSKP